MEAFHRATRWRSTSQGRQTSSPTGSDDDGSYVTFVCARGIPVCVPGLGGFPFRRPWAPKLGTRVSSSKVDKIDITGLAITNRHDWCVEASEQSHLSGGWTGRAEGERRASGGWVEGDSRLRKDGDAD
jgi:hypothetical protein